MKHDVSSHTRSELGLRVASTLFSRRSFCALVATGMLTTACQPFSTTITPTATPTATRPVLKTITAANANHLKQIRMLDGLPGRVRGLCWSPDGQLLAMAPTDQIQIWRGAAVKRVALFQGEAGSVNGMAWSPDGASLAVVGDKGVAQLLDTSNWRTRMVLKWQTTSAHPRAELISVAWSPTSHQLVAGNADGAILLWDTSSGKNIGMWEGPTRRADSLGRYPYAIWGITWSPDGRYIVSNRYDTYTFVWDARNGKILRQLPPQDQPNGVSYSPNGQLVATSNDVGTVQIWNQQGKNIRILDDHTQSGWAYPVMWSPDSTLLATARGEGMVQLWEVKSGHELASLQGHNSGVYTGGWSSTGTLIATGGDDATVRLWGVTS
ncbi:WD40 repeat domain-containing protein [Dictyobacter aurantiacus]|uniref:Translation initiation factor beta propellor-like domain-containing protein n=1 Tax=Dictyobacter aurantiacus TaxID=1936993 RepID=A0A401ZCB9_9CHLR|nr:WD40 repeat domain-containing protein [Dictyobacter aurantiacus]GCE04505.1 hypothetical protein KDAU_18340 [Dictyobacter aurantiacus]